MPTDKQCFRSEATTHEPVVFPRTDGAMELEIIRGPTPGRRFILDKRTMVVGKSRTANIKIVAHGISREHAKFVLVDDGPTTVVNIVDLGSTNGTFVNRSRVDMALIREDDRIQLGAHVTLVLSRRRAPMVVHSEPTLTPRQLEVARLVAAGAKNAEVARALEITTRAVASHLERSYRALGIGSRAELTRWLVEQDLHDDAST